MASVTAVVQRQSARISRRLPADKANGSRFFQRMSVLRAARAVIPPTGPVVARNNQSAYCCNLIGRFVGGIYVSDVMQGSGHPDWRPSVTQSPVLGRHVIRE